MSREIFLLKRDLIDSIGSEYDLEDEISIRKSSENVSEEERQNDINLQQYWTLVAKKCKEYLNSSIPSIEYERLKEIDNCSDRDSDLEDGKLEVNQHKNRYGNILPYAQTRVKLRLLDNQEGSDYINANFVGEKSEYIAAQAPTPPVFNDFWRMIYECNSKIIVMLTREYEGNKLKSNRYWPDEGEEEYGEIIVKILKEENMIDYIKRDFALQYKDSETIHYISHFHYLAWPDQGVPTEPQTLLRIIKEVNKITDTFIEKSPIVIHCSAGVGRTGAYIVIDSKLKELQSLERESLDSPPVSIEGYLKLLRRQRCGMITQKVQYLFCYEALFAEASSLAGSSADLIVDESDGYDDTDSDELA